MKDKIEDIIKEFGKKLDFIVDSGDLKDGLPSTIIQFEENTLKILREGPVKREEIERRIKK